jgi:hypothetical protein
MGGVQLLKPPNLFETNKLLLVLRLKGKRGAFGSTREATVEDVRAGTHRRGCGGSCRNDGGAARRRRRPGGLTRREGNRWRIASTRSLVGSRERCAVNGIEVEARYSRPKGRRPDGAVHGTVDWCRPVLARHDLWIVAEPLARHDGLAPSND